jgi:hypothetical protein
MMIDQLLDIHMLLSVRRASVRSLQNKTMGKKEKQIKNIRRLQVTDRHGHNICNYYEQGTKHCMEIELIM